MLLALLAAPASLLPPQPPPNLRYADGAPKGQTLSPDLLRLRGIALRKSKTAFGNPARHAARVVRVAHRAELAPSLASDLVDSIKTHYSARKRRVAVELTHAFAVDGTIIRSGTFSKLIGACRKAGELAQARSLITRLHGAGKRLNPTVYAALMGDMCAAGHTEEAMQLEASMRAAGAVPSNRTLSVLLSSLLRAGATDEAVGLAQRLCDGGPWDLPLYNVRSRISIARPLGLSLPHLCCCR